MRIPRIIVAGAGSGAGKTSVTCGIIRGLRKRGLGVQPFKVGPDYIDPGYLSEAAGRPAHNLDSWLMGEDGAREQLALHSGSDVSVIEGVMGYYDGLEGKSNAASTHRIAAITKTDAILVIDASGAARSVAATAHGFARFHKSSRIAGVILNRVGGARHERLCRDAMAGIGLPVLGAVPRMAGGQLGSRHLGLVPPAEDPRIRRRIRAIAKEISDHLDMDAIVRIAKRAGPLRAPARPRPKKESCTIAVALDGSFNFYYPENLEALRRQGARIRFFSPVSGKRLPRCDGMYIGGGFPEVAAGPLARNAAMRRQVKEAAEDGMPLYAECGGLMYLTRSIDDGSRKHRMAGLLDAETRMTGKLTLNYTRIRVASGCVMSGAGARLHGHEFHYSRLAGVPRDARFAYELETGTGISGGRDGMVQQNTLASYGHLFFRDKLASSFVGRCVQAMRG